jgi:outer membrane usher protein
MTARVPGARSCRICRGPTASLVLRAFLLAVLTAVPLSVFAQKNPQSSPAAAKDSVGGASQLSHGKDTSVQAASPPAVESDKRRMEEIFTNKSREQLYQEYFHTAPPKQPKQIQATLVVNEVTDGLIDLVYSEDRLDFSMPAAPIVKTMAEIVKPDYLDEVKEGIDSSERITRKFLMANLGIQVTYDNQASQVTIVVPAAFLKKQINEINGTYRENPYSVETTKPDFVSGFLNIQADQKLRFYQVLSKDTAGLLSSMTHEPVRQPVYSNFDGAINVEHGVLEGTALFQEDNKPVFERQDMRLVYDFPRQSIRLSAGDLQYLTFGYMSSVRMAGLGIAKDFSLQPYVLTYPVGEYQFYLTEASQAEIWVNDVMVSKIILQAGTHDVRGFPFSTGNNRVKIILTDFSGRTQTIEFNFLYQQALLAKGLAEYSFNAGFPQTTQEHYSYYFDEPSLSCAYRQGLTNRLTLGAFAQAFSQGVAAGTFSHGIGSATFVQDSSLEPSIRCAVLGGDALYAIPVGTIELGAAGSYGKGQGPDAAARLTFNYMSDLFNNRTGTNKKNALRLSAPITWTTQVEYLGPKFFNDPRNSRYTLDREGLDLSSSINLSLADQLNISAGGRFYFRRDTTNFFDLTLTANKTWLRNLRVSASLGLASEVYSTRANPYAMLSLSYTFRNGNNDFFANDAITKQPLPTAAQLSQTGTSATQAEWGNHAGLSWNYDDPTPRPEKPTASVSTDFDQDLNDYNASLGYTCNQGTVQIQHDVNEPLNSGADYLRHQTDITLKTALVCTDKAVCLSRPIYGGGFVLAKGVKSLSDDKIMINPNPQGYDATTTILGPAVLPLFESYDLKRIRVEPQNPSLGSVTEKNAFTLFPQYKSGFSIAVGSDKKILVTGQLLDYDDSSFAYQAITIIRVGAKKPDSVSTFTNGAGRFQCLGVVAGTYEILASDSTNREPITFKVPKTSKEFCSIGQLKFSTEEGGAAPDRKGAHQ